VGEDGLADRGHLAGRVVVERPQDALRERRAQLRSAVAAVVVRQVVDDVVEQGSRDGDVRVGLLGLADRLRVAHDVERMVEVVRRVVTVGQRASGDLD